MTAHRVTTAHGTVEVQTMNPGEVTLRLGEDETDLTVAESRRLRRALLAAEKEAMP